MSLVSLVVTLLIVGVLLWAVNKFGAEFVDAKILRIINIVVVIAVVVYVLYAFLGGGNVRDIQVPTLR